jgi:crotonobetainyl-CoA:carnitine CoA-transferase CaiB-like acyl-CoA transferase
VQARGDLQHVDDPVIGQVLQQAAYPRLAGSVPEVPTGAPQLGEHTDEVLGELLGFDGAELAELRRAGVI